MFISEFCAECLYNKQKKRTDNASYLTEVKSLLDHRAETDTAPYMVYLLNKLYDKYLGKIDDFTIEKRTYNDLALSMEKQCELLIESAEDSLLQAILYARVGNYIDFGAMNNVDDKIFLSLFADVKASEQDYVTYLSFVEQCKNAKTLVLLADNAGEIVFDKLLVKQLKKSFPKLDITVLVRGGNVLNDATLDDAAYVGMMDIVNVISNGNTVAGTVYSMLSPEAKAAIDYSDVILSKGQGNYESISRQGFHIFYLFLCKCDLFTNRFQVPKLTGMFIEE